MRYFILTLLSILFFLFISSCKPIYNSVNNVNKSIDYTTKEDYLIKIKEKYDIDTSKVVFIDSTQKIDFLNYIINEKVVYIYGIVIDKEYKIENDYIQENNSCYSRVTNLIKNNPELTGEKLVPTKISNFNYVNSKNKLIKLEGNKILLFIFSTRLGRSIINDIKDITEEFKTNEAYNTYNYYLISID